MWSLAEIVSIGIATHSFATSGVMEDLSRKGHYLMISARAEKGKKMHSDNEMVNLRSVVEVLCYMVNDDSDGVEEVMQLPTIDLVRCRECKYWQPHEQYGYDEDNDEYHDYCGLLVPEDEYYAFTRNADDFCSYGVRKERSK